MPKTDDHDSVASSGNAGNAMTDEDDVGFWNQLQGSNRETEREREREREKDGRL